ncbi:MAG: type I restriction endonuclease subunit R [Microbacteriaceae bacterium]|nr:type I restriction endonuclease subunit R [Microbacteriaceae bacterium]
MRAFNILQEGTFEAAITDHLTSLGGWQSGDATDFDPQLGIFPGSVFRFLEATQPNELKRLQKAYGDGWKARLLQTLEKTLATSGTLHVLRKGLEDINLSRPLRLAFFKPASGMNPETLAAYDANILEVTRQVHHSVRNPADSLDLVLSVNGIPVATAELKNPFTGQSYENAIRQYRHDRHPSDGPILEFKRGALVHFAVDPDVAFMTTRLAGPETAFLPFNRGKAGGAGNDEDPARGYRTAYLWHDVWERHSWLDIIARFVHLDVKETTDAKGRKSRREGTIFPRFHQWDAVTRIEADVLVNGAGGNYLVQHSAGSGKSNSIAWLAHRLHSLHDRGDRRVFDSVVVITDRRVLDQQLQATISQFDHRAGVIETIDDKLGAKSPRLAKALNEGKPIIVCTLQSFGAVFESQHEVLDQTNKRFAIIVDEAHSSQHGQAAQALRSVLGDAEPPDADPEIAGDVDPFVLAAIRRKGPQGNLSFFAFTATPKKRTIEVFGTRRGGEPVPFHVYSMRQAIEEGFILDVLQRYTTYKAYYRLSKAIEDDPEVDKKKAKRAIARFMSIHPHNLAQKTEVMVEHFRSFVRDRIGGKAKAMVVTASREQAARYHGEFKSYIAKRGYTDIGVLVAFSGDLTIDGAKVTEVSLNGGIAERDLPTRFGSDAYHLLIVAEKYQTGFDQPLLHTMYVDKRLDGLQAVQTLSRLNRTHPDKAADDTFVLDFVNEADDIKKAFAPFYETAAIDEPTDPQQVFTLKNQLDEFRYYYQQDVEDFAAVFFRADPKNRASDQGKLYAALAPAVKRFEDENDEDRQEDFKAKLVQYVRLYGMLAQMIAIGDERLEKLYVFADLLRKRLPKREGSGLLDLTEDVRLDFYKLSKTGEGSASLAPGDATAITGPSAVGTGRAAEEDVSPLSEIIGKVNDRYNTEFAEEHRVYLEVERQRLASDPQLRQQAMVNSRDQFEHAFNSRADLNLIRGMDAHNGLVNALMKDQKVWHALRKEMMRVVYEDIRSGEGIPT